MFLCNLQEKHKFKKANKFAHLKTATTKIKEENS